MNKSAICLAVAVSCVPLYAYTAQADGGSSPAGMPPGVYPVNGVALPGGGSSTWTDAHISKKGAIGMHQGYTISIGGQTPIGAVSDPPGVNIPSNTTVGSQPYPIQNYNYLFGASSGGVKGQEGVYPSNTFEGFTFRSTNYCGGNASDTVPCAFTVVMQGQGTGFYHLAVPATNATVGTCTYTVPKTSWAPNVSFYKPGPGTGGEFPAKMAIVFYGYPGGTFPQQTTTWVRNYHINLQGVVGLNGPDLAETGNINTAPNSPNSFSGAFPWELVQNVGFAAADSDFNFDTAPFGPFGS